MEPAAARTYGSAALGEAEMLALKVGIEQGAQQTRDLGTLGYACLLPVQLAAELPHVLSNMSSQLSEAFSTRCAFASNLALADTERPQRTRSTRTALRIGSATERACSPHWLREESATAARVLKSRRGVLCDAWLAGGSMST